MPVALLWTAPGAACAIAYVLVDFAGHMRPIEGLPKGFVHSALARV